MGNEVAVEAQRSADERWTWLGPLLEKIYKDAVTHGFKHGVEYERMCSAQNRASGQEVIE